MDEAVHEGVGVAADHEVDPAGLRDEGLVFIVADVGQEDDQVALLFVVEVVRPAVGHLDVVELRQARGDGLGHVGGEVRLETDDADLHPAAVEDGVGLDDLAHLEAGEVEVGADDLRLGPDRLEARGQGLDIVVEFVIAQGDAVVGEVVDDARLKHAAQLAEIGRALAEIAGVQQQDAVLAVDGTDRVHERGTLDAAAEAVVFAAAHGLEMAVRVVGMQDHQLGLPAAGAAGRDGSCEQDQHLSHCATSSFLTTTRPSVLYSSGVPEAPRLRT